MVISCDLSPSSATNTTERLTSVAVSIGTTFRHVADGSSARDPPDFGRRSRPPRCGSPAGLAQLVLLACALPVCRLDDWGLLPFADFIDDSGDFTHSPAGGPSSGARIECSGQRIKWFENPYAASSIAKIAVSGWLMGSTPTRLTIEVTVPSASASTHAARCSRPRCGSPGRSTQPDAAPVHSGSDGMVSEGGCSMSSAGGWCSAKCPGGTADSPTTVPSAKNSPTAPGPGSSGSSSRAPKIVVVESNPGSDATRTATISSCAHSLVESGQRPETTNPLRDPRE